MLLVDRDGNGDFDGEAENRTLSFAGPNAPIAVTLSETGRAIVATRSELYLDVEP